MRGTKQATDGVEGCSPLQVALYFGMSGGPEPLFWCGPAVAVLNTVRPVVQLLSVHREQQGKE